MTVHRCLGLCGALLAAAPPLVAQGGAPAVAPPAAADTVQLTFDLGFVNSAGNTEVTTLSLAGALEFRNVRWEAWQVGSVVYGRTGDSTTAEQLKIASRLGHRLARGLRLFVGVTYERNRFAGIARRLEEYAGLALRLVDRPRDHWTVEAGASVNQQRSTAAQDRGFAAGRFATVYRHRFTKASFAQQTIEALPDLQASRDLRINAESALVAPLAGRVALKLSYVVRYDHLPEPGFRKSDRVLTTALQIVF